MKECDNSKITNYI